jgi:predicted dehydrogenase
MARLRVGIIGVGKGQDHIRDVQLFCPELAEVVAIADADARRLAEVGEALGVAARYSTGEAMLADRALALDIVGIVTPNFTHAPLTIQALEAGCHVLCEKPMAMNATEARAMLAASRSSGRRLMINFSYRFNPQSQALKAIVDRGELGTIYAGRTLWYRRRGIPWFGSWFTQKQFAGGGPLIDLGVHRLDLALWLMGYPRPAWVLARTYLHLAAEDAVRTGKVMDVEDMASGMITFENGASLLVEAAWKAHLGESDLMETRLFGTRAGLVQRNVGEGYDWEAQVYLERDGSTLDLTVHGTRVYDTMEEIRAFDRKDAAHRPEGMQHFVRAIAAGTPHTATGEEGLVVQEILDALYLSAERGEPVRMA